MKVKTYVRIARADTGRTKIAASSKPSDEPLKDSYGDALPTVAFAVEFVVADGAFDRARKLIASVDVQSPEPLATVRQLDDVAARGDR